VYQSEETRRTEAAAAALQVAGFNQQTAERVAKQVFDRESQIKDQEFQAAERKAASDLQTTLQQRGFDSAEKMAELNSKYESALASLNIDAAATAAEKAQAFQIALVGKQIDADTARDLANHAFITSERIASTAAEVAAQTAQNEFQKQLEELEYTEPKAAAVVQNLWQAAQNEANRKTSVEVAKITGDAYKYAMGPGFSEDVALGATSWLGGGGLPTPRPAQGAATPAPVPKKVQETQAAVPMEGVSLYDIGSGVVYDPKTQKYVPKGATAPAAPAPKKIVNPVR
jgi:hypothetical protein